MTTKAVIDDADRAARSPDANDAEEVEATRVLIVDDHTLMRSALRLLLETRLGFEVTEVASAEEAVHAVAAGRFAVVLMDVSMPGKDGLWGLREIRRMRPRLPVVMLSYLADETSVREALASGACGYLLKDSKIDQLSDSISTAITGKGIYLHPVAAECLVTKRYVGSGEELTEREMDVLTLLVEGATNEEIAVKLFITEKTVKSHLSGVFRKLGVGNRTQAATKALREGLIVSDASDTAS